MCLTPITLKNTYRKINSGKDHTPRYQDGAKRVPCGQCSQCLKRRQNGWTFRLQQEQKISTSAVFVTFTYENTPYSPRGLPTLQKSDFQNFIKRLRKKMHNPVKYYACGEYGTQTHRPHYHAIVFNLPSNWINDPTQLYQTWQHGEIHLGEANVKSMHYVVGYMQKGKWQKNEILDETTGELFEDDRIPEFSLMSKKMGLSYITPQMEKFHKNGLRSYVTQSGGQKSSLPRYFRDKIFTKEERQLMNEDAELQRDEHFTKHFNESFKHELQWKIQTQEKTEKNNRLSRAKL